MTDREARELFQRLLTESGKSLHQLSRLSACSKSHISRVRGGFEVPGFARGVRLLEACGWVVTIRKADE